MELTGFDIPEIDLMLHCESINEEIEEEPLPLPNDPVARVGDMFALGPHRIMCGDTCDIDVVKHLMENESADMVLTDVPYNLDISDVRGNGKHGFSNFPMAHSEYTSTEFTVFLHQSLSNLAQHSSDGSLHYIFMDWRHLCELHHACKDIFSMQINLCVWCKNNGGLGSFYRSQHELIAIYKLGAKPHINNIELGKHGRYRTNVWNYPGLSSFGHDRDSELALHATPKNISLLHDAILDATHPNHIVLDGFLGSGSTLIAAHRAHRRCFGIELDARFIDVTILRWQQETDEPAIHIESGLTFSELADQRAKTTELNHE
jgi:DNA modification methylase